MGNVGTMLLMEKPRTRIELVGAIARLEVQSTSSVVAAADKAGVARSQLYRLFEGDATVGDTIMRRFERAFNLPPLLFAAVLDGDIQWVEKAEFDPWIKAFVLDALRDIERPPVPRRKGSRREA